MKQLFTLFQIFGLVVLLVPNQLNAQSNLHGNCEGPNFYYCDQCPDDPDKVYPGRCGCGYAEENIWRNRNIGRAFGWASYPDCAANDGTYRISARGTSGRSSDRRHMVYIRLCDDAEIQAKVTFVSRRMWAGISFRQSLSSTSMNVSVLADLRDNIEWRNKSFFFGNTVIREEERPGHMWLRIRRDGNTYRSFTSTDGENWELLHSRNLNLGECPYVGLFAEGKSRRSRGTVRFREVSVDGVPYDNNGSLNVVLPPSTEAQTTNANQNVGSFEIFPNPTVDNINLNLDGWDDQAIQVRIFNNQGQMMFEQNMEELPLGALPINTSQLNSGLYWLQISSQGKKSKIKKFVKK